MKLLKAYHQYSILSQLTLQEWHHQLILLI